MLFKLIKRSIVEEREGVCDRTVYFSGISECTKISKDEVTEVADLSCNHEEADTKLVALAAACSAEPGSTIMVRSPSGDIDILALFVRNLRKNDKQRVLQSTKKSSSEKGKKKRKSLTSARKGFIDKLRRRKRGIIFKEGLLNLKTS